MLKILKKKHTHCARRIRRKQKTRALRTEKEKTKHARPSNALLDEVGSYQGSVMPTAPCERETPSAYRVALWVPREGGARRGRGRSQAGKRGGARRGRGRSLFLTWEMGRLFFIFIFSYFINNSKSELSLLAQHRKTRYFFELLSIDV